MVVQWEGLMHMSALRMCGRGRGGCKTERPCCSRFGRRSRCSARSFGPCGGRPPGEGESGPAPFALEIATYAQLLVHT